MKIFKIILISLSALVNLLCLPLLWILFKIGDEKYKIENSKEYYLKNLQCVKLENVVDSISYASQLGRLDTIALILTIFGIVLGFVAIFGFMAIKESSEIVARNAAETWIRESAGPMSEKIINEILRGNKSTENAEKEVKNSKNTDVKNKEEYKNL